MKKLIKATVNYVRAKVDHYGTVSVNIQIMNDQILKELQKHFEVKKEPFGYYQFKDKQL